MKRFTWNKELYFRPKALTENLGKNNFIFVGSSCDMWADAVPSEWIGNTLTHCNLYSNNKYLFQTKNPERMRNYINEIPHGSLLGITYESNRQYDVSKAPLIEWRVWNACLLRGQFDIMISMEPILDFNAELVISDMLNIRPKFISIGADSKGHHLPEPTPEKIRALIVALKYCKIEVIKKDNLKRLVK